MLSRIRTSPTFAKNVLRSLPSNAFSTVVKKQPLVDRVKEIDTSLTEEQRVYVDSLKKKLRGGVHSPRCKIIFAVFLCMNNGSCSNLQRSANS